MEVVILCAAPAASIASTICGSAMSGMSERCSPVAGSRTGIVRLGSTGTHLPAMNPVRWISEGDSIVKFAIRLIQVLEDYIRHLCRAAIAAQIGSRLPRSKAGRYCRPDHVSASFVSQPLKHQCTAENRRCRISDSLSGDIGSRTMHRLAHRRDLTLGVEICA